MSIARAQRSSLVPDTQACPQPGVSLTFGVSDTSGPGSPCSGRRLTPPACAPRVRCTSFPVNTLAPSHDVFSRISLCLRGLQNMQTHNGQDANSTPWHQSYLRDVSHYFPLTVRGRVAGVRLLPLLSSQPPLDKEAGVSACGCPTPLAQAQTPSFPPHTQWPVHAFLFTYFFSTEQVILCVEYSIVVDCSSWT